MPEGPEVRREADAIARALVGAPLVRADYRVPALAARARRLAGATVTGVRTRGKAMLIAFDCGLTHYSHNQLYGEWRVGMRHPAADDARAVRVVLAAGPRAAVLYSATEIALLDPRELARHPFLARLGPDALDRDTTPALVAGRLADPRFARRTLAQLLLDQSFIAGLGNYLRSDILFTAGVRGAARPADLGDDVRARLAAAIVSLPRRSYKTGGVTRPDSASARTGAIDEDDRRFLVYARAGRPCWTCGGRIRRVEAAGRGLFECARCQAAAPGRPGRPPA